MMAVAGALARQAVEELACQPLGMPIRLLLL